jgi:uncharacterized protein YtpQ (UPF0354 family)
MLPSNTKKFVHPHSVYQVDYPGHWDQIVKKDGESCGFGPHERDDVGLWISIMPMSLDTEKITDELPNLMEKALAKSEAANLKPDSSLRHYGLIADVTKEGEGGHYWIVAGGDVVLFASSQVPAAERNVWNPQFQQLMASLEIKRDDELLAIQVAGDVMSLLREKHPEEEFTYDNGKIRLGNRVIYLGNLSREVRAEPERRESLVKHFVKNLSHSDMAGVGQEVLDQVRTTIVPVLKHRDYISADGPTQNLLTTEWLADVLIVYAIKSKKLFRFVTPWDLDRWGIEAPALEKLAVENLTNLPWPREVVGARSHSGGRIMVIQTDDNLASSRLLHPELHKVFANALGSPFWAGIPCRDRLVLFSDRKALKQRVARKLRKDSETSGYPITPNPFLVTRDGIAPGGKR